MWQDVNENVDTYSSTKMEQTKCSETLAFQLQTPVNHPEDSTQVVFCFENGSKISGS
jgi:hypothetical protein